MTDHEEIELFKDELVIFEEILNKQYGENNFKLSHVVHDYAYLFEITTEPHTYYFRLGDWKGEKQYWKSISTEVQEETGLEIYDETIFFDTFEEMCDSFIQRLY